MKKTLLTLVLVAAGLVQADSVVFDYTNNGAAHKPIASPAVTSSLGTVTIGTVTMTGTLDNGNAWEDSYIDRVQGGQVLTPWINIINDNATWTYTLSFTLASDITLDSIDLAIFSSNGIAGGANAGTGNKYGGDRSSSQALTLSSGSTVLYTGELDTVTYKGTTSTAAFSVGTTDGHLSIANGSGAATTYTTTGVTLTAGQEYKLTLTVAKDTSTYENLALGIGAIGLNGTVVSTPAPGGAIPEPATATLSLLALAGLAARRRRK